MSIADRVDAMHKKCNEITIELLLKENVAVGDLIILGGFIAAKAIAAQSLGNEEEKDKLIELYVRALKYSIDKNLHILFPTKFGTPTTTSSPILETPDLLKEFMDGRKDK